MTTPRPILIVEDDAALRATLAEQIMLAGEFRIVEAGTAAEAAAKLDAGDARYDAILLDVGLPDGDGREFCAKLRRDGKRMPVIMLTGADAEQDVVRGLDAGANDYVAKPFRLDELLARVRAQLRVFDNSEDAVFTVGPTCSAPRQAAAGAGQEPQDPADGQGIQHPEVPVPGGRQAGAAPGAAERGVGLQQRGDHAHAGDAHLPPAPEDRAGPGQHPPAAHEGGGYRLDAQAGQDQHRRHSHR
jgi:CheY-like chemotaxis protein